MRYTEFLQGLFIGEGNRNRWHLQKGVQIMGYRNVVVMPLCISNISTNMADSSTYYFGNVNRAATTTAAQSKVYPGYTGVIRKAMIQWLNDNDGSDEDTSIYIRINNTTDYLVYTGSVGFATGVGDVSNAALNIPMSATDYFEIKVVTPAWATNPTSCKISGNIMYETG